VFLITAMHFLNLLVFLFMVIPGYFTQRLPCTYTVSGITYDFGALQNASFEYTQNGLTFYVTPCAITPRSTTRCVRESPAIYWDDTFCWYCGQLTTQEFTKNPDGTIELVYSSGESGGGCNSRQVNLIFECDPENGGIYKGQFTTVVRCEYSLYWKTKYACDSYYTSAQPNVLTGGGWFLIIIFAIALPIYLVGGIYYKYKIKGATGIEVCPNIEFWKDLPFLVLDGCKYTKSKIQIASAYQKL